MSEQEYIEKIRKLDLPNDCPVKQVILEKRPEKMHLLLAPFTCDSKTCHCCFPAKERGKHNAK